MDLKDKTVLVAGAGKSGVDSSRLLLSRGARVVLFDEKTKETEDEVKARVASKGELDIWIGELKKDRLSEIAFMVISPGIAVDAPFTEIIREKNIPIWSEIELAYTLSESREIAAITGTNGKTTTTTLVGEIMKEYNSSTFVVGNIGTPYTSAANDIKKESAVVAEISSFQLETIIDFKPRVSAILNLTPDHLDRHYTFENYANTKKKITMNQTSSEVCVLNYDDELCRKFADSIPARPLFFSRTHDLEEGVYTSDGYIVIRENGKKLPVIKLSDIKLLGTHNIENYMAAIAIAYSMDVPIATIEKVCKAFMGVEHRIEYVRTVNGVDYYNDSKGTNPDAAIKAVEAMVKPAILIGGGYDKGSSYDEWVESFGKKVKKLVLIGKTAEKIAKCCDEHDFKDYVMAEDFESAVKLCAESAEDGDCVLLSPACASWDMFKSYEERGRIFKDLVNKL